MDGAAERAGSVDGLEPAGASRLSVTPHGHSRSPVYSITDAKWHHCGALSKKIVHGHWQAYREAGIDVRGQLRQIWGESFHRKTWLVDGRIVAMGGLKGTILSRSAEIWLAVAPEVETKRFAFLRMALANLDEVSREKRELRTTIAEHDGTALRFAKWLGFVENGPPVQIGESGVFIVPFVLRR